MTTEHDFQKALEATLEYQRSVNHTKDSDYPYKHKDGEEVMYHHNETIRFALRLADKLLKQEVSDAVVDAFAETVRIQIIEGIPVVVNFEELYKAMLTTAVKEIENEIQK